MTPQTIVCSTPVNYHPERCSCPTLNRRTPAPTISFFLHRAKTNTHPLWTARRASHLHLPLSRSTHFEAQRRKCARAVVSAFLRRATACFNRASTDRNKFTSTCGGPPSRKGKWRDCLQELLPSVQTTKLQKPGADGSYVLCDWRRA